MEYMSVHRIEEVPLRFQINSKVNEEDIFSLRELSRTEKTSQAALIRAVVREYIKQKQQNPSVA